MIDRREISEYLQDRGSFTLCPNELWKLPISDTSVRLFGYLMSHTQGWSPGIRTILKHLSITQYKFEKSLVELEEHNMLRIEKEGNKRNVYILNSPNKWGVSVADTPNTPTVSVADTHTKQSTKQIYIPSIESTYTEPLKSTLNCGSKRPQEREEVECSITGNTYAR